MQLTNKLAVLLLLFVQILSLTAQARADETTVFFEATQRRFVQISRSPTADRKILCERTTAAIFDLRVVAMAIALPATWNAMSETNRRHLTQVTTSRLARECQKLADRGDPARARIVKITQRPEGVRMTVLAPDTDGNHRAIVWTLRPDAYRHLKAVDITIDGRSAAITLRHEFANALGARHGDINEAIDVFSRMGG